MTDQALAPERPAVSSPRTLSRSNGNEPASTADRLQVIRRRISEYRETSLSKGDPLEAALGAYNADLITIGSHVQEAIKAYLATDPCNIDRIQTALPILGTALQVARQIDRFSQIELQERRRRQEVAAPRK